MQENHGKGYTATIIQDSEHYIKQASAHDAFVNLFKSNRIRNPDKGYTSEAAQGPDDLQRMPSMPCPQNMSIASAMQIPRLH